MAETNALPCGQRRRLTPIPSRTLLPQFPKRAERRDWFAHKSTFCFLDSKLNRTGPNELSFSPRAIRMGKAYGAVLNRAYDVWSVLTGQTYCLSGPLHTQWPDWAFGHCYTARNWAHSCSSTWTYCIISVCLWMGIASIRKYSASTMSCTCY